MRGDEFSSARQVSPPLHKPDATNQHFPDSLPWCGLRPLSSPLTDASAAGLLNHRRFALPCAVILASAVVSALCRPKSHAGFKAWIGIVPRKITAPPGNCVEAKKVLPTPLAIRRFSR
jgi:hypothetical protein